MSGVNFTLYIKEKGILTGEKVKKAIKEIATEDPKVTLEFFHNQKSPQSIQCDFKYQGDEFPVSLDYDPEFDSSLESQEKISLESRSDKINDILIVLYNKLPGLFIFDPGSGRTEIPISEFEHPRKTDYCDGYVIHSWEETSQELAEEWVKANQHDFSITLDYSEKSIADLDKIIEKTLNRDGFFGKKAIKWAGSYLGETIRKNIGGEWKNAPFLNRGRITTGMINVGKRQETIFPYDQVYFRVQNGSIDSLVEYYQKLK